MVHQPTNSGSCVALHLKAFTIVAVAACLLSSLPSHFTGAMSVRSTSGERHSTASLDKDLKQIAASGSGVELMENPQTSSDEDLQGKIQNNLGYDSEKEESPLEDAENVYSSPEKPHPFQNKNKLRLNKRYRLRTSKRRLRFQKRRQAYADEEEYPMAEAQDMREANLRLLAHEVRKRSPSSTSSTEQHRGDIGDDDVERDQLQPLPRHRRETFPIFSVYRRTPTGNDLQALGDLYRRHQDQLNREEFNRLLENMGKR